jgi:hypothetical protein
VAVGAFSLWQLTEFRCGSWRIFVVAVGGIIYFAIGIMMLSLYRIHWDKEKKQNIS